MQIGRIWVKLAVLRWLSHQVEPIGLPELLSKLPEGYVERTTRRWLNELNEEGLVRKSGNKRGTKYQVGKRQEVSGTQTSSYFGSISVGLLERVNQPIYQRLPIAYQEQWFDSYVPNTTFYLAEDLRNQMMMAGTRSKLDDPAGTYAHQIFNRLLIDLSYNSSRLEGNTYSRLDSDSCKKSLTKPL